MIARRPLWVLGALAAIAALMLGAAPAGAAPGDPLTAPAPTPGGTGSTGSAGGAGASPVRVDLVSVTPMTPNVADAMQAVTITAVAVNTSGTTYTGLRANLDRGSAIVQPQLLGDAIATPPATEEWRSRPASQPQPAPLPPGGSATITFVTTPGFDGMCLCFDGVFPYDLVVEGSTGSGWSEVGRAATVIPSFTTQQPRRTTVSWVWPLIDQPHRIGTSAVFVDDDLAKSVSSGGRLDRALQVVEQVAASARITVLIDPRLLDELITMTSGYTVRTPSGDQPGASAGAASAWLARLHAVAPSADIALTPYGDPDPQTALAVGHPVTSTLPAGVDARVRQALGVDPRTDIAWPDAGALTPDALAAIVGGGASAVLLPAAMLAEKSALPDTALSPATAGGASFDAVAVDPALQSLVEQAVSRDQLRDPGAPAAATSGHTQTSATRIQALLAQLALWPFNGKDGFVAVTPPRRVDADPDAAAAAIVATASQSFSRVEGLSSALGDQPRLSRGAVQLSPQGAPATELLAAITAAQQSMAAANSLLGETAATVLPSVADELVEATAAAWRSDPGRGVQFADLAGAQAQAITNSVVLVTPDNASYSLPSENSPLILTLRNDLPYAVQVRVVVTPALGSAAGFTAEDVGVVALPPDGTRTLRVPAHFERSGRFQIEAQLTTADGKPLSDPVRLNVLCTAIGGVALAVTGIAFGLLVCLLIFRAVRGLRRRRAATLSGVAAQTSTRDGDAAAEPQPIDGGPASS